MSAIPQIESALDALAALRDEALKKQRASEDAAESYAERGDHDRLRSAREDINRYLERASAFGIALRTVERVLEGGNLPTKAGNG